MLFVLGLRMRAHLLSHHHHKILIFLEQSPETIQHFHVHAIVLGIVEEAVSVIENAVTVA